jgi:hypothetical protein
MNWFFSNIKKIGFEDVKILIDEKDTVTIINTLSSVEQHCLIKNTLLYDKEEETINDLLEKCNYRKKIMIYGKNNLDDTVEHKYRQLAGLGFLQIYIYQGGMFEWLLLQDVFGETDFPTIGRTLDLLKYSPKKNK